MALLQNVRLAGVEALNKLLGMLGMHPSQKTFFSSRFSVQSRDLDNVTTARLPVVLSKQTALSQDVSTAYILFPLHAREKTNSGRSPPKKSGFGFLFERESLSPSPVLGSRDLRVCLSNVSRHNDITECWTLFSAHRRSRHLRTSVKAYVINVA